ANSCMRFPSDSLYLCVRKQLGFGDRWSIWTVGSCNNSRRWFYCRNSKLGESAARGRICHCWHCGGVSLDDMVDSLILCSVAIILTVAFGAAADFFLLGGHGFGRVGVAG